MRPVKGFEDIKIKQEYAVFLWNSFVGNTKAKAEYNNKNLTEIITNHFKEEANESN